MNPPILSRVLFIILFCVHSIHAQSDTTQINDSISGFYILDEVWSPGKSQRYKTDESPNYIQIEEGAAVVCSRFRGKSIFIEGKVNEAKLVHRAGEVITSFFIRGDVWSIGKIMSVQITEKKNGDIIILLYQKLGMGEAYFSAHKATKEEINAIKNYWDR